DIARIHNIYSYGVVTTEKDSVRLLSPDFSDLLREVWYLKIGLRFADGGAGARALSAVAEAVA
ncbi:MAG: tetraacyldisaccharide 4'-kinase, partial [Chitinispirillales bacterium]|nr:tetraacyldisaccharide 4'-kinase [Chitinispirillales bacterium]